MNPRDNDLHIRPGRIRDGGRGAARPKSFVGQVMRAARKAGHTGKGFGRQGAIQALFSVGVVPRRLPCHSARRRVGS